MIKCIVFDLDGVICSTDEFHFLAWKKIADQESIYFDRTINNRLRGVSRMDSLNIILERTSRVYSKVEKEALAEQKNRYYRESLEQLTPAFISPNVRSTLLALKAMGVIMAIGSASKNAPLIVDKTDIRQYFKVVVDGSMISHGKPDPEVFLLAKKLLGHKEKAIVVEDSFAGIEAALRGDFIPVAIGEARNSPLAKEKISSLEELIPLIKKID